MRGLKRQIRGADGRSNAVGSRRNAPTTRRTCASSIYNTPRTSTFPDRRRIFPLLPTPFASMVQLFARTPLTATRAFTHSPATSTPCAPSSQPLYRVLAPFAHSCGTQPHHEGIYLSTREVNR